MRKRCCDLIELIGITLLQVKSTKQFCRRLRFISERI